MAVGGRRVERERGGQGAVRVEPQVGERDAVEGERDRLALAWPLPLAGLGFAGAVGAASGRGPCSCCLAAALSRPCWPGLAGLPASAVAGTASSAAEARRAVGRITPSLTARHARALTLLARCPADSREVRRIVHGRCAKAPATGVGRGYGCGDGAGAGSSSAGARETLIAFTSSTPSRILPSTLTRSVG